jgi:hypothetical protein
VRIDRSVGSSELRARLIETLLAGLSSAQDEARVEGVAGIHGDGCGRPGARCRPPSRMTASWPSLGVAEEARLLLSAPLTFVALTED